MVDSVTPHLIIKRFFYFCTSLWVKGFIYFSFFITFVRSRVWKCVGRPILLNIYAMLVCHFFQGGTGRKLRNSPCHLPESSDKNSGFSIDRRFSLFPAFPGLLTPKCLIYVFRNIFFFFTFCHRLTEAIRENFKLNFCASVLFLG